MPWVDPEISDDKLVIALFFCGTVFSVAWTVFGHHYDMLKSAFVSPVCFVFFSTFVPAFLSSLSTVFEAVRLLTVTRRCLEGMGDSP